MFGMCQAQETIRFDAFANLTGAAEIPPNDSGASARGEFGLWQNGVSYLITSGGPGLLLPMASYIEGPVTPGGPDRALFTLAPYELIVPPPGELGPTEMTVSGWLALTEAQKGDLLSGLWSVNLASDRYPAGEIRGRIVPVAVPEPQVWALLGLGAAVLLLARLPSRKRWRT
jgi:hypothetical protein